MAVHIFTVVSVVAARGPGQLPRLLGRSILTLGLCVFLYRGAKWARWVTIILLVIAGLGSLIGGLMALSTSWASLILLIMGLVYVASAIILLFNPKARDYFETRTVGSP
jgi:hypothetical protein